MATSKLQRYMGDKLDANFPEFRIRENYRPEWLMSSNGSYLEIDFYIEELNVAIEVQGDQHYSFIPFFHKTVGEFEKSKQRDAEKVDLLRGHNCRIFEIMTKTDADILISTIADDLRRNSPHTSSYYYQPDKDLSHLSKKKKRFCDTDFQEKERLTRCVENLKLYEDGMIQASDEKVENWKRVIRDNGADIDFGKRENR